MRFGVGGAWVKPRVFRLRVDGNIKGNFENANYYVEKRYLFFLIQQPCKGNLAGSQVMESSRKLWWGSNPLLQWKRAGSGLVEDDRRNKSIRETKGRKCRRMLSTPEHLTCNN
jgi:hypothetical protein